MVPPLAVRLTEVEEERAARGVRLVPELRRRIPEPVAMAEEGSVRRPLATTERGLFVASWRVPRLRAPECEM
jgi:hypothetical protein